jgi:hypothetical protein
MKYSDGWLRKAASLWDDQFLHYVDADVKKEAHDKAARILNSFALECLGLDKTRYSVRSNKAGIACSGEVTLHTDPLDGCDKGIYIQIGQWSVGNSTVLFRCATSRSDYVGQQNHWASVSKVFGTNEGMAKFAAEVRNMCAALDTPRY